MENANANVDTNELEGIPNNGGDDDSSVRFEDLTVDDDLPIMDRVVRYTRSNIALQRLVHVKMLAETAQLAGPLATHRVLVPSIQPLLQDAESVIRQHLAAQLLPVAVTCMLPNRPASDYISGSYYNDSSKAADQIVDSAYDTAGYQVVLQTILGEYLNNTLLRDEELEVRKAAADAISGLSLLVRPQDVSAHCLPVALELALDEAPTPSSNNNNATGTTKNKRTEEEQRHEELRITAVNLLAEMAGAASEVPHRVAMAQPWVRQTVLPAVLELARDVSFRVRRCAAQAMPRLLGACQVRDAREEILPAFDTLSRDDIHRVRKSTGECLVDMSRAIMIMVSSVAASTEGEEQAEELYELRRSRLLPIAERLIQDSHKMVRQGMMQFLGPFMASFYPYQYSSLHTLLPHTTESDGSNHVGIVAQFFPHATSMVSRLNSSQSATATAPTPVHASLAELSPQRNNNSGRHSTQSLDAALPLFLHASRLSAWSLAAVASHYDQHGDHSQRQHPQPPRPQEKDVQAVVDTLLDYFVALAAVATGDDNTDAEMRVYCAYSFPAIVLLLGREHWEGAVRTCFHTLLNPKYPQERTTANAEPVDEDDEDEDEDEFEPPLPVKRCLASSLHTVAHILGREIAVADILGIVQNCFLTDSDDSVRLSTIRNFPALLKLLPVPDRREPFLLWSEVVVSEELLGGKKRSATNPTVLNWRQRDYLARSLPDLLLLVDPALVHKHLWPILKTLLADSINVVRDDALWSIPILLKCYCADTLAQWPHIAEHAKKFSTEACLEVVTWIQENILLRRSNSRSSSSKQQQQSANFDVRQLYCRICAAVGMALRFGPGDLRDDDERAVKDPVSVLSDKFKSFFYTEERGGSGSKIADDNGPYQRLTVPEQKHLRRLLMDVLLPPALEMKEDRISNVRITLMKALQIMPDDVRAIPTVKAVLKDLEDESATWTSFGEEEPSLVAQHDQMVQQQQQQKAKKTPAAASHTGPVDVDTMGAVQVTQGGVVTTETVPSSDSDVDEGPKPAIAKATTEETTADGIDPYVVSKVDKTGLQIVVFEEGSIGMQLEPTADDSGCRVCGFLDAEDGSPSPARASGKIRIGDVILRVNGTTFDSYDSTIAALRTGGRRKIVFRPGKPEDANESDESDNSEDTRRREKKAKRDALAKRSKREKTKKDEKDKDRKKPKKDKKVKKEKKKKDVDEVSA